MNYAKHILPIRVPLSMAQASKRPRWSRRTIQSSFILLGCISLFTLYEYTSYLADDESSPDIADVYDTELDSVYLPFQPVPYQPSLTLRFTSLLPDACLDNHLAQGELCYNPQQPKLDVVWTWVNGSDILLQDAKARVESSYPADAAYRPNKSWKQARQFRDHDELKHSMRSVLEHFGQHAGTFHLITSDFDMPLGPNVTTSRPWRLGQVPQWLDTKQATHGWSDGDVHLSIVHHADIFYPYSDTIFNSYAIESQFGHLDNIADNFIYLNDDFYFMNPLTERTFYTSAYGLVFRMQGDLLVSPTQYSNNVKGEWRSLAASNVILSARFGVRQRPYVAHEAKSASLAILHEMSVIWSSQIASTATHPFRETLHGESDFSNMFMMVHFVVERWREALLWSWAVARHGGVDDSWGKAEMDTAWAQLGGEAKMERLEVQAGRRGSLDAKRVEENLKLSGLGEPDPTHYAFTSQDGYPYTNFEQKNKARVWPKFGIDTPSDELPTCTIDYEQCFTDGKGHSHSRASEMFKNIAFRNPSCGDCMILALLKASGSTGLSAFLPPSTRVLSTLAGKIASQRIDEVPHLPLVEHWEDGDFSLREVMGSSRDTSVRSWTLQLLQRYRFVIGETPAHFAMLTSPSDTRSMIRRLVETDVVLLCINDDVAIGHDEVQVLLKNWQDEQWRHPAAWEI